MKERKLTNKADYEVFAYHSGYFAIINLNINAVVYGGDSACEDHYNKEHIESVYADWDGELVYDPIYGWKIEL